MKLLLFTTLFSLLGLATINAQNGFDLSIVKSSELTTNSYEHFYLFELKNNASIAQSFICKTEEVSCNIKGHKTHASFNVELYDASKRALLSEINLGKNQSKTFYVKVSIPKSTKLSTWNCSAIKAQNLTTNEKQEINLVSFLQDPKNVN